MKYVVGIIVIIVLLNFYNSYSEKKAKDLKNKITCIEFLDSSSPECLDAPISYVNKIAKKKAKQNMKSFKQDLENLDVKLEKFHLDTKVNESDYKIISWSEARYIDVILSEKKNKKVDLYDKKIVAIGKIPGCYPLNKEKYFFCTNTKRFEDSESRTPIIIENMENLSSLKEIYEEFKIVSNSRPCVITRTEGPPHPTTGKEEVFIYESPDNGKTIYKRKFGDYKNKTLVKMDGLN